MPRIRPGALAAFLLTAAAAPAHAQIPSEFTNLQHFPADISRDSLISVMRGFSFALSVRCQYCHVGGDGISFEGVDFASDEDPHKRTARVMLALGDDINARLDAELHPGPDTATVTVKCATCHRSRARPLLLADELRAALDAGGADSAVAYYDAAREVVESGRFDFGKWEVNVLAERLEAEGRLRDAIAIYRLNAGHHPRSTSIHGALGRLYEEVGDTAAAIAAYHRVTELSPGNARAEARIAALLGR